MKIEIWTDFICPFCYFGNQRLTTALEQFPHKDKVYIQYRSYELTSDYNNISDYVEEYIEKEQLSTIDKHELITFIETQAAKVNETFAMEPLPFLNTFDVHRLIKYAYQQQKGNKLVELLFRAYFLESSNISDHDILIDLASKAGLDPVQAEVILQTCKFTKSVRFDEEQAKELGISTVPFFVFNETYAVSGIQPTAVFIDVLNKVWEEEMANDLKEFSTEPPNLTYYCDSDGCRKID